MTIRIFVSFMFGRTLSTDLEILYYNRYSRSNFIPNRKTEGRYKPVPTKVSKDDEKSEAGFTTIITLLLFLDLVE